MLSHTMCIFFNKILANPPLQFVLLIDALLFVAHDVISYC